MSVSSLSQSSSFSLPYHLLALPVKVYIFGNKRCRARVSVMVRLRNFSEQGEKIGLMIVYIHAPRFQHTLGLGSAG